MRAGGPRGRTPGRPGRAKLSGRSERSIPWKVGAASACAPVCGDGIEAGPEECDDGNTTSGDGCSSTCHVEDDG
ncbi:DUF4215 domain-containing protein [Sorangium sp. So ce204]|uniref:DUF4215 domain-containing protein n=1 Tax=Sorangium sp. So ce204 TaxID=3133288 RepID=UPI003F5E35CA